MRNQPRRPCWAWARLVSNQRPLACEARHSSVCPRRRNPHCQAEFTSVRPGDRRPADYQGLRTITWDSGRESGILPRPSTRAWQPRSGHLGFVKRYSWKPRHSGYARSARRPNRSEILRGRCRRRTWRASESGRPRWRRDPAGAHSSIAVRARPSLPTSIRRSIMRTGSCPTMLRRRIKASRGVVRATERWAEPFQELTVELERIVGAGDCLVSIHTFRARAKHTGIEFDEPLAILWRFRNGPVIYFRSFREPGEALEAAGLRG